MSLKSIKLSLLSLLAMVMFAPVMSAADAPIKREMRSAWLATVWQLDWPLNKITSTGDATQIQKQKDAMTTLLDSMVVNNLNAVNFQVRARSDAFYKSSYEPWSSDLVQTRGMDPGWDPLEWVVAECHKRGLECHAWVNPYRYESQVGQWNGTPQCYREEHPEWLLDVNGASILNPGLPEVTRRIVDVIREIVKNYDIDGVLFDDYFYLQGTPTDSSGDGDLYAAYLETGGTLSQSDWRRENVNGMVDAVYKMIQEEKPWVRFGISPAGVSGTKPEHVRKYGLPVCNAGSSDWQYDGIFSDPIAWIANQSLDYISPQIYWTIGNTTNYATITPWWAEVAAKYNRHFYTSHSITSLGYSDTGYTPQSMSLMEQSIKDIATPKASGTNNGSYQEFANQIRLNRTSTLNDAPGSIFYSAKYLYKSSPKFAHYLKKTVFNTPAILPAMDYKPGYNPGVITNLSRNGAVLTWKGFENVRYTVYAVPSSMPMQNFNKEAEYLLGTAYATTFTVPDNKLSGYTYAVCVLDRYGNEYSPVFIGVPTQSMPAPTLVYPAAGASAETPFEFTWNAVANASSYIIEIASDRAFTKMLYTRLCNTTSCSTDVFEHMPITGELYWRVRSCGNGYSDGISEVRAFKPIILTITEPASGSTGVSLTPAIKWNLSDREVTVEIATSIDFTGSSMVYSAKASNGSITIPANTLGSYTTYFVRLGYVKDGNQLYTDAVSFTTIEIIPTAPAIVYPVEGGDFYSEDQIWVSPVAGISKIRVELDASTTFARTRFVEDCEAGKWCTGKKAGEMKVSSKNLVAGTLYYIRARGTYASSEGTMNTDWSPVVKAYYRGEGAGVESVEVSSQGIYVIDGDMPELCVNRNGKVKVSVVTPSGITLGNIFDGEVNGSVNIPLSNLVAGIYIIVVDTTDGRVTLKATL